MKSVGSLLISARKKEGYTIDDVHRVIKIHPKYIKALERDDYTIFEGTVHAKGFLKIYAEYLKLDLNEIMALWRREYEPSIEKHNESFYKIKSVEPEKIVITPGVLAMVLSAVLLLGFFSYLFFQYKQFTGEPTLDVFYPTDNLTSSQDIVDITGQAEIDSKVYINNQEIISDPDGSFVTSIKLREGINTISIKAINKLSKETEILRNIIYRVERPEPTVQEIKETTPEISTQESSE